jgi:hypothetical protein
MLNHEAGRIVKRMLERDYFASFTREDRVYDPDGIYEIEAEMVNPEDSNFYLWNGAQREALYIVAGMSPEQRAEYLEIELESDQEDEGKTA